MKAMQNLAEVGESILGYWMREWSIGRRGFGRFRLCGAREFW